MDYIYCVGLELVPHSLLEVISSLAYNFSKQIMILFPWKKSAVLFRNIIVS